MSSSTIAWLRMAMCMSWYLSFVLDILFRICDGRGCKRCYHLSCLDPPLDDFPPGAWHCSWCVKKKIESGVHSVTEGVESIQDVREVEVAGTKGLMDKYLHAVDICTGAGWLCDMNSFNVCHIS